MLCPNEKLKTLLSTVIMFHKSLAYPYLNQYSKIEQEYISLLALLKKTIWYVSPFEGLYSHMSLKSLICRYEI